jgi:hypothetical protein
MAQNNTNNAEKIEILNKNTKLNLLVLQINLEKQSKQ